MTVTVRRAGLADSAAAWTIVDEYSHDAGVVLDDDTASFRTYLAGTGSLWLAEDGALPVGCVAMRPLDDVETGAAEVKRLYVRPSYRRAGVADALMRALESYARAAKISALYLDTKDDLAAAIAFYERRGYVRIARYNDNPQATMFMRLGLGASQRGSS